MATPPIFVKAAREIWNCEWHILMNGLAPSDSKGNYKRPENLQKEINIPTKEDLENRKSDQMPYLIVGKSCPWAHRVWIMHEIKGLKATINLHIAKVNTSSGRWIFVPPLKGCKFFVECFQVSCNYLLNLKVQAHSLKYSIHNSKFPWLFLQILVV